MIIIYYKTKDAVYMIQKLFTLLIGRQIQKENYENKK